MEQRRVFARGAALIEFAAQKFNRRPGYFAGKVGMEKLLLAGLLTLCQANIALANSRTSLLPQIYYDVILQSHGKWGVGNPAHCGMKKGTIEIKGNFLSSHVNEKLYHHSIVYADKNETHTIIGFKTRDANVYFIFDIDERGNLISIYGNTVVNHNEQFDKSKFTKDNLELYPCK